MSDFITRKYKFVSFPGLTGSSLRSISLRYALTHVSLINGEREKIETHWGVTPIVRLATNGQLTIESGSTVSHIVAKIK